MRRKAEFAAFLRFSCVDGTGGVNALTPRQAHLLGVLRRADENWLQLWQLAQRAGYTSRITAANVRELRRRRLVVCRPCWYALSATEVSLAGPETS
jgi:hypothetical protein